MANLRTTAEAFACAVDLCFVSMVEVQAWIDGQMMDLPQPPIELIEACGAGESSQRVLDFLRKLPGKVDRKCVIRQSFHHARSSLLRDASMVRPIANWLFRLAVDNESPNSEAESLMYWFDDELDLVGSGTKSGSWDDVVHAMEAFLDEYGEPPNKPMQRDGHSPAADRQNRWAD